MKNIKCEFCHNAINIEKDKKCPTCGAAYGNNKDYKRIMESESTHDSLSIEDKKLNLKMKEQAIEGVKQTGKFAKVFIIIFLIMFITIPAVVIFSIISFSIRVKDHTPDIDTPEINTPVINTPDPFEGLYDKKEDRLIEVDNDIVAGTKNYELQVDRIEINTIKDFFTKKAMKPESGKKYVTIHLLLTDKTNKSHVLIPKISLLVDNLAQKEEFDHFRDKIPSSIQAGVKYEGYYTFIVDKKVKIYDLKFEDKAIFHLNEDEMLKKTK